MKLNKPIQIIIAIVVCLCIAAIIFSFYLLQGEKTDKIISFASNLFRLSFTIGTFLIAILLYDRFGFRKKIYERKLEIVIEVLNELKTTTITLNYNNNTDNKGALIPVYPNKRMIEKIKPFNEINLYSYVIFDSITLKSSLSKISLLINNPFLPKEIASSLEFLNFNELWGVGNDKSLIDEHSMIFFNIPPKTHISDVKDFCTGQKKITLKQFLENFENLFNTIEDWLNNHSNVRNDLNI